MPHIEVTTPSSSAHLVGKSASCSKLIAESDSAISGSHRQGRCRRVTTLALGGCGRNDDGIRIEVTLHKPLRWQVTAAERASVSSRNRHYDSCSSESISGKYGL